MPHAEHKGQPVLEFSDATAWEAWLREHHDHDGGVWLRHAKRASGVATVTHAQALDVAICFGWIDAQRLPQDATYYLQRFIARRPRSRWSQVNCAKATALTEAGRMHPRGLAEVAAAKADGRWDSAYAPQSRAAVPPDLQRALDGDPAAKAFFETLTGGRRYAFLYRLTTIKRPETRARRVEQYVEMLREGRTLHD
jgi:uncharacterized protein YdeI (YjbR/CyaY-like superfamily)